MAGIYSDCSTGEIMIINNCHQIDVCAMGVKYKDTNSLYGVSPTVFVRLELFLRLLFREHAATVWYIHHMVCC